MNKELSELTEKLQEVMDKYKEEYPHVEMDRDYVPFKITEEWGECIQAYLMLTDRARQKGKSKEGIKKNLEEEFADVFAYMLLFAKQEGIDPIEVVKGKWLSYLNENS